MLHVKYEGVEGEHELSSDKQRGFKPCCTSLYPTTTTLSKGSISYAEDAEAGPQFLTHKLTVLPACNSYMHFLLH